MAPIHFYLSYIIFEIFFYYRKPLHTIEESNELFQNSLHNQQTAELEDETLKNDKNQDLSGDKSINETDSLISEIRHLFSCFDSSVSEERTRYDTEEEDLECQGTSDCENRNEKPCPEGNRTNQFGACESKCLTSPSCNLMQQFETAAKTEAAALIQFWYRGKLERKSYLKKRRSAVVLQRHVRSFLASR